MSTKAEKTRTGRWAPLMARARGSVAFTLFLSVFVTYAFFYQGGGQNESARFDSIRALLEHHSLVVDSYAYNSADLIKFNGHYYSSKSPGTFYLGIPIFAVTSAAMIIAGVPEQLRYHWVCYFTTIFTVSLCAALTVALMYKLGVRLKASRAEAASVALAIGLGTLFFPFATVFFSHVATAAFLFFAFYQIFAFIQDGVKVADEWRILAAGFALGFSISLEYPAAIACVLIGLYAMWNFARRAPGRSFWTLLSWFVGAGVCGLIPLFVYNLAAFSNAFYVTYEAYAQSTNTDFTAHKKGLLGIRIPLWDPEAWPLFLGNLAEITFKPLRGLFFLNPVLLLVFPGAALLARRKWRLRFTWPAELTLALSLFAAYLFMTAGFGDSIVYWGGGTSFGPRHVIVAVPFLAILLHSGLKLSWARALFPFLAATSIFTSLMATAIEPRTPYRPLNPLFQFYWPKFVSGELALNESGTFSNLLFTTNSVAFNFGKLWGLPMALQLVPLYLIWVGFARRLDRQLGIPSRGFFYFTALFTLALALLPIAGLAQ